MGRFSLLALLEVVGLAIVLIALASSISHAQRPISYGQCVGDTITAADPTHRYFFLGSAGDVITVRMTSSWNYYPRFEVYDQGGNLLRAVVGSGYLGTYSIRLDTMRLEGAGMYWIWVMDDDGLQFGSYNPYVQRTREPVGADSIVYGETKADSIGPRA